MITALIQIAAKTSAKATTKATTKATVEVIVSSFDTMQQSSIWVLLK
jgi:hypothetical protein